MLSREGEGGFSVRKLGVAIGVDPMTVLHREELLRQVADRALNSVELPLPTGDWKGDMRAVADAYREACRPAPPAPLHLHFRFHATGARRPQVDEVVYRALRLAGLPDEEAAGLGLAFYAFILGHALAEAEGLLRPISGEDEADPLHYSGDARPSRPSRHSTPTPRSRRLSRRSSTAWRQLRGVIPAIAEGSGVSKGTGEGRVWTPT